MFKSVVAERDSGWRQIMGGDQSYQKITMISILAYSMITIAFANAQTQAQSSDIQQSYMTDDDIIYPSIVSEVPPSTEYGIGAPSEDIITADGAPYIPPVDSEIKLPYMTDGYMDVSSYPSAVSEASVGYATESAPAEATETQSDYVYTGGAGANMGVIGMAVALLAPLLM